ncbi:MAG: alpha-L-fucosidase [Bacteroidales bacterium]|nr:alpha-L-fucosidase [Bacteroidales bacterium]
MAIFALRFLLAMKRLLLISLLCLLPLCAGAQSWESLNQRGYPQWFSDAKLGIFVHWGLYSVPAYASPEGYAEWFYRGLMVGDTARRGVMSQYADTSLPVLEQYRELTKYWKAERWNPDEWAALFKDAGARYVVLVTKHHDGYCLWDSPQQPQWNSVTSGPRRNIVEELTSAVRKQGMRMGFYYSLPEWTNPRHIWMQDPDSLIGDYVDNYMVPQFKELVSRYSPSLIFVDGDWQNSAEQFRSSELIDWYYRTVGDSAIVNNRWGGGTQHGFKTPEYSSAILDTLTPWAECRGIGRSFGYNRNESPENYLGDGELIRHFCELVAHGGGLTLNVGPMADGTIPELQRQRLLTLGHWLKVNGEAIYGCRPWRTVCITEHRTAELPSVDGIDFDWVRNAPLAEMPVDNFDLHWQGSVSAPEEGDYIFRIEANDEATVSYSRSNSTDAIVAGVGMSDLERRKMNDTLLCYNHGWAENGDAEHTLHLRKNEDHLFFVDYHERDLEAAVNFSWSRDGGKSFEPVPAQWRGTAAWQRTIRCFTTKDDHLYIIEFDRPGQTLVLPDMPRLKKGTKVTLLGTKGDLKWKQKKDGTLSIDLSSLNPDEFNALDHAWVLKIK